MARFIALRPMTLFGLSALMIFYAHLNFYEDKQRAFNTLYRLLDISYNSNGSEPFLTIFRDKHRKSFLHQRVEDNPLTYKYLHVYMAVFWSIVMPLQHIDSFRVKYPTAHRVCGYLTLTGSFLLAATGLTFPFRGLSYSLPAPLSFHYAFGKWYLPFITFNQGLFLAAIPQLFTLYKTVKYARRRAFAKHRYWAVLHTTSCYAIHLFRVYLAIAFMLGTVLAKSPLTFQTALGVPQGLQEKEDAERAVFAFCTVLAGITGFAWTRKVLSQAPKQM